MNLIPSFLFSQNEQKVKIAVLIDDVGMKTDALDLFFEFGEKLNFAVLPFLPKSKECYEIILKSQNKAILHMPMQSMAHPEMNAKTVGMISIEMTNSLIENKLNEALGQFPNVEGFNNHMGSKFTSNSLKMNVVLQFGKARNLFFIDSNTYTKPSKNGKVENPETALAYNLAKNLGLKTFYNSFFIDNENEIPYIENALLEAARQALITGNLLIIGHYRQNTAQALCNMKQKMLQMGIEFVFITELF